MTIDPTAFEKLGAFYLGRRVDDAPSRAVTDEPVVLESRDLVTHAVCLGMTGSGKTGLCIALLEEAAIDGVPAIVVDPKGDLANLCLTFPQMSASDLAPWLDPAEASRKGVNVDALAAQTATRWREGWTATGQDGARVQRFKDAADIVVFTPGSNAGVPLAPLGALLPPPAARADDEARREHCATTASALLSLVGEDTTSTSPAHVVITLILDDAARKPTASDVGGERFDLAALLRALQKPPFDRVGLLDLETFFPATARMALVMKLNAALAAPSMAAWLEGTPLDAETLLVGASGKPRLSIVNVAHLSDDERIVFVARLLGELLAWTRAQRGTQSLRALLFIDEVMGYMPPVANPATKQPLLTLMKQGRAFGVGVVVATQNPVDLDYKALGNTGTWLLGRLQTERDRARVLDGLAGASLAVDRASLEKELASLEKRQFLLVSAHRPEPVLLESRQTLSFLAGPLTKPQLAQLRAPSTAVPTTAAGAPPASTGTTRPIVEPGVVELFSTSGEGAYVAHAYARVRVHYSDAKRAIELDDTLHLAAPIGSDGTVDVRAARTIDAPSTSTQPNSARSFGAVPSQAARKSTWDALRKAFVDDVVAQRPLKLAHAPQLGVVQKPGTTVDAFKADVLHAAREARDAELAKVKAKMQPKIDALDEKARRAQEKVRREESEASSATLDTALTVGTTVLGALFGRKALSATNMRRASSSARKATRAAGARDDVAAAREELARIEAQAADLAIELDEAQRTIEARTPALDVLEIKAKRADVDVEQLALLWL